MSVDTAQLRRLIERHRDAVAKVESLAVHDHAQRMSRAESDALVEASEDASSARYVLRAAAVECLPDLLDELDAARALLTEVAEHGLASFDPVRARVDLTRRIAAFLES